MKRILKTKAIIKEMLRYDKVKECAICRRPCLYALNWDAFWGTNTPKKYRASGTCAGQWLPYYYTDGKMVSDDDLKKMKLQFGVLICNRCHKRHFDIISVNGLNREFPKTDSGREMDALRIIARGEFGKKCTQCTP